MKGVGPDGVAHPGSSGIKVIIVGLGYSGAAAAVECHRKGHDVVVYEQWPGISQLGDIIGITGNAAQIVAKWGNGSVHRRLEPILSSWRANNIRRFDTGEILYPQPMVGYNAGSGYTAPRGPMAIILSNHLRDLGVPVHFDKCIQDYFETETDAGIVVEGEKISADCVIACDGVHSKARSFVVGIDDRPYPTGYATYRAWFDATEAKKNPKLAWMFEGDSDKMETYIGNDMHCILGTCSGMKGVVWTITHKDEYDNVAESWSFPGKHEDVLNYVKGWHERIFDVVLATPKNQLVDYKLVWRDPLPKWVSEHARIILIGDSAHPFLPTSAQGAGQAIEDGATIAICLELAGKTKVPLALRTCERLRYARASLAQQIGKETREIWHKTDWELAKKNPQSLSMPLPSWLFGHDPQRYAYEEFDAAASSVQNGTAYVPKNIPPQGQNHRVFDFKVEDASPWVKGEVQPRARL
ncbi:uncharacterized protein A1O5_08790 [Cladophialophora psammophila CBS 110553]|uniref:FAD-binding domain-containing protein n=1 Tax=Cladophialophora psammophila CBS 110553 TaxID=1182543 RepID=W9WT19_9EURO|nr:uncharacterized protein A1O5_08790 [Cladophialophora psammophila CBS 110553]EXJ68175.1 hypothetical protein A1O5_08790 [Cladophialophora psammophila CBS 110553]